MTAAAAILIAEGVLATVTVLAQPGPPVFLAGIGVVAVATGIGLLRLSGAARLAAGVLAALAIWVDVFALLQMAEDLLAGRSMSGPAAPVELIASLVVLFAITRRWPTPSHQSRTQASPSR